MDDEPVLSIGHAPSAVKRLYRFLDKPFFHKARWEFDLKEFGGEHAGWPAATMRSA